MLHRINTYILQTVILLFALWHLPIYAANTNVGSISEAQYQQIIFDKVNEYRQSKGLSPLQLHAYIAEQAHVHSEHMASHQVSLGHDGFSERLHDIFNKMPHPKGGAENVARYKISPDLVVQKWLESPLHRKNIEGDYNLTGIGVVSNEAGEIYYTQIFVKTETL